MRRYSLSHLADDLLLRDLAKHLAHERSSTADVLAHIAEVDARKLYLPAGYPSMYAYCVGKLHLSEDAAWKRLQAAHAARRCPGVFVALAQGRLHLSAVVLLAPRLTPENADDLIAAATHQSKSAIEQLLAARFPRPAVESRLEPIAAAPLSLAPDGPAPGQVGVGSVDGQGELAPAPGQVGERPRVTPLAPEAFALQCTLDRAAHDDLRHAQSLLGHRRAGADIGKLIGRALKLLVAQLEKGKFAATSKPRPGRKRASSARHIPAHVQRAVWERDRGQCTFVSESGHRCEARTGIEFDHVRELARGGEATIEGIRLRCRAHNQYTAEQTFGAGFMRAKREEARARAEARHASGHVETPHMRSGGARRHSSPTSPTHGMEVGQDDRNAGSAELHGADDVVPCLRKLGYSPAEARRAAASCESPPKASLEERVRLALRVLLPPIARSHRSPACDPRTSWTSADRAGR